jgi:formate hydrogenlyase subunit 6/NADH:ubiquinone oxidoreductase subunit I
MVHWRCLHNWRVGRATGERSLHLTYVITAICVADYSCVEICPENAISPGPDDRRFDRTDQLFIDPSRCIDCAACLEACPVGAIFKGDQLPPRWADSANLNQAFFKDKANG